MNCMCFLYVSTSIQLMEVKTATYSSSKKLSLSQKLKFKKHAKNDSQITLEFFCLKKNIKYSTKKNILKTRNHANPIAFAERSVWEKN